MSAKMNLSASQFVNDVIIPGWNFFINKFGQKFLQEAGLTSIGEQKEGDPQKDFKDIICTLLDHYQAVIKVVKTGPLPGRHQVIQATTGDYIASTEKLKELFAVLAPMTQDPQPIICDRQELLKRCRDKEERIYRGRTRMIWEPEKQTSETGYLAYGIFGHKMNSPPRNDGNLDENNKGFEFCLFVQILAYLYTTRDIFERAGERGHFSSGEPDSLMNKGRQYGFGEDLVKILPDLGLLLVGEKPPPIPPRNLRCESIRKGKVHLKWDLPQDVNCDGVILDRRSDRRSKGKWEILVDKRLRDEWEDDCKSLKGEKVVYRIRGVYHNKRIVDHRTLELDVWIPDDPKLEKAEWAEGCIRLKWIAARNSRRTLVFRCEGRQPKVEKDRPASSDTIFLGRVEETAYEDTSDLRPGREYSYLLVAEYEDGACSDGLLATVSIPPPPAAPTKVEAEYLFDEKAGQGQVRITVHPDRDADGVTYRIFRYIFEQGQVNLATETLVEETSSALSWIDRQLGVAKRYIYQATPIRGGVLGQSEQSKPTAVVPGVWNLQCEAADRTVEFKYEAHPSVEDVWIRRGEERYPKDQHDGVRIRTSRFGTRDTQLQNGRTYYYLITCRYQLFDGTVAWSKPQRRSLAPGVKPEAVRLVTRREDDKVVCSLGAPRAGRLVVLRVSERPGFRFADRLAIREMEGLGVEIQVDGRVATDRKPNPNEPYYIVFTVCDEDGYALAGDCRKHVLVPDVRDVRYFLVSGGVRLTWKWPEHCKSVLVLKAKNKDPGLPSCEKKGNAIVWSSADGEVAEVLRDDYEEDGDSCFLNLAIDSDPWYIIVLGVVGDAIAPGEAPGCRCTIETTTQVRLDYRIHRRGRKLTLMWRVNPDVQVGFTLVGSDGRPPDGISSGKTLYPESSEEKWPRPDARGVRRVTIRWPYNGDGYCRVFLTGSGPLEPQVAIRHPEGIFNPVAIDRFTRCLPAFGKVDSLRLERPRHVLCPYCYTQFGWWQVRFYDEGSLRETPLAWWRRVLAITHLCRAASESVLTHHPELMKVCPKHCREVRSSGRPAVDLDNALFRDPSLHMGLLGTPVVGKSHWIFGAIRRLEAAGLAPIGGHTHEQLKAMRERVISGRTPLKRNRPPEDDEQVPPLLFQASGAQKKAVLGFCDVDGESWGIYGKAGKMRYLWASQGFVYIVDPLQMPSVRRMLGTSLPEDALKEEDCLPQVRALNELLKGLGQRATPKYRIPIAVVLSKGDAIRDHDPAVRESLWEQPLYHRHQGALTYDLALHWKVQFAVRGFLLKHDPGLVANIESNFSHFAYFCVAPTGCSARNNRFARFAPWRVEEPVLWIFAKLGFIPVV